MKLKTTALIILACLSTPLQAKGYCYIELGFGNNTSFNNLTKWNNADSTGVIASASCLKQLSNKPVWFLKSQYLHASQVSDNLPESSLDHIGLAIQYRFWISK